MAASSSTTRNSNNNAARMLRYTVIMACITSQLLSVDAIRCHQCNSHLNEDCIALRLNTPRAPRDDQYLKECEGEHRATAFCRKTVLTIQITGERRIVRGCGWIYDQIQECTLDKMKSINTWLFDLNKFAYFDTGANKSPLMNCQKVVAKDTHTNKMVTARFCQLDTGDSDACAILRSKLRIPPEMPQNTQTNMGRRMVQSQSEADQQFHCSICTRDNCNGARSVQSGIMTLAGGGALLAAATFIVFHVNERATVW